MARIEPTRGFATLLLLLWCLNEAGAITVFTWRCHQAHSAQAAPIAEERFGIALPRQVFL